MQRHRLMEIDARHPSRSARPIEPQVRAEDEATSTIPIRLAGAINRFVFFGLLALIAASAVPYGTVQLWWKMAFVGTVLALTAMCLVESLLSGTWFVLSYRLLLPLFGLVVYALLQTLPLPWASDQAGRTLSADRYETLLWSFQFLALTLVGLLLMRYTSNLRRLRALVYVIIGIGVVSAIFGIARQTMQGPTMGFVLPNLGPAKGYGQFINYNHFAFLMEMAFGLLLGLVVAGGVRRDRVLTHLAMVSPIWVAIVLSNSRGGILSMLCQVMLVVVMLPGVMRRARADQESEERISRVWRLARSLPVRLLLVGCLLAGVAAATVWVGGERLLNRLDGPADSSVSESQQLSRAGRGDIWRATWRLIKANPVTGVGFGGYWTAITAYHEASGEMRWEQAHNDYLELLASGGLIGAALVVWFGALCLRRSRRNLSSKDSFSRAATYGALIGLFGVAVHSFVDFGLHVIVNALVFTALLVIATTNSGVPKGHNSDAKTPQADRSG
jgi:putative inorganic carbon (hco3(-)) transporter